MLKNVVGILFGIVKFDEIVMYLVYWDYFGYCDVVKGDDICNGVVDNVIGVVGLVVLVEVSVKVGLVKCS